MPSILSKRSIRNASKNSKCLTNENYVNISFKLVIVILSVINCMFYNSMMFEDNMFEKFPLYCLFWTFAILLVVGGKNNINTFIFEANLLINEFFIVFFGFRSNQYSIEKFPTFLYGVPFIILASRFVVSTYGKKD